MDNTKKPCYRKFPEKWPNSRVAISVKVVFFGPIFRSAQSFEIRILSYCFRHPLNYRKQLLKNLYKFAPHELKIPTLHPNYNGYERRY